MQPMAIEWDALHQPTRLLAYLATPLPHTPAASGHCAQRHRGATETTIMGRLAQMVDGG